MPEDYYADLGVDRGASQTEIEKAYRNLARKYHPDLNQDDKTAKTKFQQVQRAFEVLKDPEKRENFDRYGTDQPMGPGGPGGNPFSGGRAGPGGVEFDFSEIFGGGFSSGGAGFEDVMRNMGAGQRPRRPSRGRDIQHELTVPFATAVSGGDAQLNIRRGDGKTECLEVKIPAGIEDNKTIRLRGQGEAAPNGEGSPGDILIKVRVSPHPCFSRRGKNLEIRVPVTVSEAALGIKVEIPAPRGALSLSIPPGTSSGTKLRMKGHGVASARGSAGDLIAEVQIVLPAKIDPKAEAVYRELAETECERKQINEVRNNLKW